MQYYIMLPKRIKSLVVLKSKQAREVMQSEFDSGPPAKRTRSAEAHLEIIMTITQTVNNNKAKKDKSRPKHNPAHSRAQEASSSHNSALIAHPHARMQHTSNVAPAPGQHQLPLQQSSLPWWAWGSPPPPAPWNWNMWLPGAFNQLAPPNQANQSNMLQTVPAPVQFSGYSPVPTPVVPTATMPLMTTTTSQHPSPTTEGLTSAQQSLSTSSNSASPTSTPPDVGDDEEADPLVSVLLFTMVPGKTHKPLLSMHVSAFIKKRIWAGQYVDLAYLLETQPVPDDDKAYEFSCSNSNTDKLSLTTAKPKAKVDSYNSWNKAFRVLTEIVALKWPDQCLLMVQYVAEISDNIGKFTFAANYNCDIKFRLKKQMKLTLKWNEIDNSLWMKYFSRSGRDSYHTSASSTSAFKKNKKSDHKTCHDFNYSRCTRPVCRFPHKCNKCFRFGHNQCYCYKQQSPGSSTLATTASINILASNSSTSRQAQHTTVRASQ